MANKYSVETVFKAIDRMSAPMQRMQKRALLLGRGLERAAAGVAKLGALAGKLGVNLENAKLAAMGAAVGAGLASAKIVTTGADFEQAITTVGSVGLQTRDQIADLEREALRLGSTTQFTATQAAQAMELMARAGFKNHEILSGVGGVLNAAAASGLEMAEVANHVSNVLKGMGLQASEATRVADVLALASARTNSSIGSLGESMANAASTARALGVPLEDTVAAVALLQDIGLDASVAGSAVNTMLTQMAKPTDDVAAKMKKWGISFKRANGDMLSFSEVLGQLATASDKAGGNFDQVAFFADLVGLRGQKAAANLADLFRAGKFQTLSEELRGASGSAERMAKLRMNSLKGDFELLKSAIDGASISLFGMQSGPLRSVTRALTAWVNDALPYVKQFFEGVGRGFLQVLPHVQKFLNLGQGGTDWMQRLARAGELIGQRLPVILALVVTGLGLVVSAIDAAIRAVDWFQSKWVALFTAVSAGWRTAKGVAVAAFEFMVGAATIGVRAILLALGPIVPAFAAVWGAVSAGASLAWGALTSAASAAFALLTAVFAPLSGFFGAIWDGMVAGFMRAFDVIASKLAWVVDTVREVGRFQLGEQGAPGAAPPAAPQVLPPAERAVSVSAKQSVDGEIRVSGATQNMSVAKQPASGVKLKLQPSGAL